MKDISLWVEKFRPKSLEEMLLTQDVRAFLEKCIKEKEIPHLLLAGAPGTGKTSIVKILIRELEAEALVLNASDERGIDVVRDKVKRFLMVESMTRTKIVFFDEADALTPPAQFSLRNMMEEFALHNRFVFSVNYLYKIIEPIRSRFQLLEFRTLTAKEQFSLLAKVLRTQNVEYNDDDVLRLVSDCNGDLRKMINEAQKMSLDGKLVYSGSVELVDIQVIWDAIKTRSWNKIKEKVSDRSVDIHEVYRRLFDFVFNDVSQDVAVSVIGEYAYRNELVTDKIMNFICMSYELAKYV